MSEGLEEPRLRLEDEPDEERREDVTEVETEREAPEPPPEQEELPAEEDELPGRQHVPGELQIPDGYGVIEGEPSGGRRSVGVVVARFNGEITGELVGRQPDVATGGDARLAAMVVTTDAPVPPAVIEDIVATDGFVDGRTVAL